MTTPATARSGQGGGQLTLTFEVASDPLLWLLHPAHDRWQRSVFDHFFDSGLKSGGSLTIVDRESARVIGASRYDNYKIERDEIEIGWTYIGRAYWGGIYNGQIKQLMLDHIFRQVGTVAFTVGTTNLRSRRALEKLGATLRDETTSRLMAGKSV
ncbi:N-acetylglutamate synthase [Sphingomonas antarctica]|uniref:GNAT family N-acetyltransferase n=1 Tax=Sphingomonas antarctica TaxID=2040274 RepID=UPI0039EA7F84